MHAVSGALSLPSRGAFHLSLTVLCTIGHQLAFSLGGWSPRLQAGFHVSRPTLRRPDISFDLQGCHLLWRGFPSRFVDLHATEPVWAPPLSLTTTEGISVDFFSSGYLDVSVPRVSLRWTMYSSRGYANAWVSPFGIAMVKDPLRLAWHFRGLARPSSPADAKASPACIPSLKSCFPAIQLDLLLHEQLESTILD